MVLYIESRITDPRYNLALEQFVFDHLDRKNSYFMLWQNHNSVIVGKNQNTLAEINAAFVNEHGIRVVRRLSGGGAVYHDLGNLNFTFITGAGKENTLSFAEFCEPIKNALISLGVPAAISGRNDMTVEGKKISGNAQYVKKGRVMHHGTLLYDSDLEMLSKVLNAAEQKIESKGIKSVKSRVTNIRPYMKNDMPVGDFWRALKNYFFSSSDMQEYLLKSDEESEVARLKEQVYSQWNWNYGASPPHNIRKSLRIEGCGTIEILLDIGKKGIIKNISFYGDFFGNDETSALTAILAGHYFEYNEIKVVISGMDISRYFFNLNEKQFLSLLFE